MAVAALIDGAANRVRVEQRAAAGIHAEGDGRIQLHLFAEGETRARAAAAECCPCIDSRCPPDGAGRSVLPAPDRPVTIRNFMLASPSFVQSSPRIRTSGSSCTPVCSKTRCSTCRINSSMSRAVAPPMLTIKPACFSLTCAPPTVRPRRPQSSMSLAAKCPSGRLNVLPALGSVQRLLLPPRLGAFAPSARGWPRGRRGASASVACVTTTPASISALWR